MQVAPDAGVDADDEDAPVAGGRLVHRRNGDVPPVEHVADMGEERLAGGSEAGGGRLPHEQVGTEVPLEQADLLRQRRLRDVEPLGRSGEVQLLGHGHEVPEVAQRDGPVPRHVRRDR